MAVRHEDEVELLGNLGRDADAAAAHIFGLTPDEHTHAAAVSWQLAADLTDMLEVLRFVPL